MTVITGIVPLQFLRGNNEATSIGTKNRTGKNDFNGQDPPKKIKRFHHPSFCTTHTYNTSWNWIQAEIAPTCTDAHWVFGAWVLRASKKLLGLPPLVKRNVTRRQLVSHRRATRPRTRADGGLPEVAAQKNCSLSTTCLAASPWSGKWVCKNSSCGTVTHLLCLLCAATAPPWRADERHTEPTELKCAYFFAPVIVLRL